MNLDEALYTTRAMRRVKPDPVPDDVVHRIVDAAVRSPSGGNQQGYRFVTVSARETKIELGRLYAEAWDLLRGLDPTDDQSSQPQDPSADDRSTQWQVDHFAEIPLWVLTFGVDPCKSWSPLVASASTIPAVWSLMLAARGQGLGTALTTMLGMYRNKEVCELIGVPSGESWLNYAAVSVGYPTGRWGVAKRRPSNEVAFAERWGDAAHWNGETPLWTDSN
jgi:nitroreductase